MVDQSLKSFLVDLEKEFEPNSAITRVRAEGNNIVVEGNQQGLMSIAISMLYVASQAPSDGIQIPTLHSTGLKQVLVTPLLDVEVAIEAEVPGPANDWN